MAKSKILKGDVVKVIAGSHKGQIGPITSISKDKQWVSVQGITVKKHVKPTNEDNEGGIKDIPAKLHISNVALQDPKHKDQITKVGFEIIDGKKVRIARKSKTQIKTAK
ncbi:50S ribosomal protein L24 [Mycoplasma feriruminatoris]|uniref:Large ribosomal subunit protein uL24 n=1 Tax=Mycoplasma feriruminatoris TaxID=1179777 RepID=A0AAQ3DLU7_9MOLU|nr:50S ribosomal protein L24 [Mycoplasma feriruminatoris]UKS53887.1 ribosomal protein L24 [Mycoplasma feriruminatoris]WFQ89980.1 50S ribosomal protein L24 [Mycoplasma feriruminatoris]WFQ90799.1 50S ribosomal protein L24 [Mycoplasma feriruminatoris]WFQ91621.1 50S ribosomal protein L24 [Mycoplasma feriruminatoris]WFQ92447.1 50S ribosomal protein L24 [Mycoplasma feriruminatoris]